MNTNHATSCTCADCYESVFGFAAKVKNNDRETERRLLYTGPDNPDFVCGGNCEPMCAFCKQQADIAAENNQANWEDAGYYDD